MTKSFSRFFAVCDSVDLPAGIGKRQTKIRLEEGGGGVNGTLIDQYIKV